MNDLAKAGLGPRPFARWDESEPEIVPSSRALGWLTERLGDVTPLPETPPAQIPVPAGRLPASARNALRTIVGAEHVDVRRDGRLAHAGGQSYRDVVRRRAGLDLTFPDAVVRPGSHAEVAATLAVCGEHRVAVVPYGGGTSVVGGVEAISTRHEAVLTLDLTRLNHIVDVDPLSRTATFEAGVTGPQAEQLLSPHGLTLGHVPQSFERATLGGYVATRSAGQASSGYGRIDEMLVALRVATPIGELRLGTGTPNAAGPDLRALLIGSEGTLGVITEVTLRVRPAPAERRYEIWAFPSFERGLETLRQLAQDGIAPDVVRLSDEEESEAARAMQGSRGQAASLWTGLRGVRNPAFCVLGWEGDRDSVQRRHKLGLGPVRAARAVSLGAKAGEAWRRHRFDGPRHRDVLLDKGVLVETVETATSWARLGDLYAGVRTALSDTLTELETPPLVMAHVSHLYPTGASLYFTVLARQLDTAEATLDQWARAKAAASEAIVAGGGTISHHHAVGRDHAPYLAGEIGDLGVSVLRALKETLDPHGILNPGALLSADVRQRA